jgi:hypothetical protein
VTLDGVTQTAVIASNGSFSSVFNDTAGLGVGSSPYTVGYSYTTDGTFTSVSPTTTISVTPVSPTVQVGDTGGTYDGSDFPATATVTGVNGPPAIALEGIAPAVSYYIGTYSSASQLSGLIPLGAAPTGAGSYTALARFAGSADYASAWSAPAMFVISPAADTVGLSSSVLSTVWGQSVTLVATVTPDNSGAGTVTGAVVFRDGGTSLASVPLDGNGRATLTISDLALGEHSITASYVGDTDFSGGQSAPVAQSVAQVGTEVILVPRAVMRKKQIVAVGLTAEVERVEAGDGAPTGVVVFTAKKKTLGTVAIIGGNATLTLPVKRVLNISISTVYEGAADFQASTALPIRLTEHALKAMARPLLSFQNRRAKVTHFLNRHALPGADRTHVRPTGRHPVPSSSAAP